jgi:phosphatidate cytidylyltransferase
MFRERFLVTIVLGPLGLYLVSLGGWFYFLPIAAILMMATIEYIKLTNKLNWRIPPGLLLPVVLLLWLVVLPELVTGQKLALDLTAPILLAGLMATLIYALWLYERRPEEKAWSSWLAAVVGIMLLGWLGSHFFRLRALENMALEWTLLTLIASWTTDGASFLVGRSIGRHKFSPRLSPKKTVEGYLGGIVFGTLVTAIVGTVLEMNILAVIVLSLVIAVLTPAGDLAISLLKREAGVKDSGTFLPGHGGALDRVDTIIWSVTIAYYLIPFLVQ